MDKKFLYIQKYVQMSLRNGYRFTDNKDEDYLNYISFQCISQEEAFHYQNECFLFIDIIKVNYDLHEYEETDPHYFSLINVITSLGFIEAMVKYKYRDEFGPACVPMEIEDKKMRIDKFTFDQAIAIRDNKLDEFIRNYLSNNLKYNG